MNLIQRPEPVQSSPFDSIRRFDEHGNEYWMARELMELLGYVKWERFGAKESSRLSVIARAMASCQNSGTVVQGNFTHFPKRGTRQDSTSEDWKLSRYACYLIAMNGDVTKPEIAAAQSYFAIKTREAELIIPQQNDRIRELELLAEISRNEKETAQLKDKAQGRQDYRIAAHGLATTLLLEGKQDSIVEVERVIESTIDPRSNSRYDGQSLVAVKDHLKKISGTKYKTGADIERRLEQLGEGGLIASRPITIPHKYIPTERLDEAYNALRKGDQQQLL